jgi:hypothetical protein
MRSLSGPLPRISEVANEPANSDDRLKVTAKGEAMTPATPTTRPPLPPFTGESAIQKVRLAEDGWNSRDPEKVAMAYAIDSRWRNRAEFPHGRQEIIQFLKRKWAKRGEFASERLSLPEM